MHSALVLFIIRNIMAELSVCLSVSDGNREAKAGGPVDVKSASNQHPASRSPASLLTNQGGGGR